MAQAKSVIEIWLMGGPSQLETFDPKPDAPKTINGGLKAIDTNVPGIRIHEWLPKLAGCADLYSLVRTLTHPHNGHETAVYLMQTGRLPGGRNVCPAIGTMIAKLKTEQGEYHGDLPPSVILTAAKGRFSEIGYLSPEWEPLVTGGDPNQRTFSVDGITSPEGVSARDLERRFETLALLDNLPVRLREFDDAGMEARRIMSGDGARAFDLSSESAETRNAYGRTKFGQSLLAARRLVEYGVPYITVNLTGWDSHKKHFETMGRTTAMLDQAVAALLRDLKAKSLLDSTLVWVSGEFGRRPQASWEPPWTGGRNHYARCFSALVAGGGFKGGCVVGESDEVGGSVKSRPVTPQDFLGSFCELCGVDPDVVLGKADRNTLKEIYA